MYNDHYKGRCDAEKDIDQQGFDVDVAVASFTYDLPDSEYQKGYLRGLLKSGYASQGYSLNELLINQIGVKQNDK